jgi:hypothetical protein
VSLITGQVNFCSAARAFPAAKHKIGGSAHAMEFLNIRTNVSFQGVSLALAINLCSLSSEEFRSVSRPGQQ